MVCPHYPSLLFWEIRFKFIPLKARRNQACPAGIGYRTKGAVPGCWYRYLGKRADSYWASTLRQNRCKSIFYFRR